MPHHSLPSPLARRGDGPDPIDIHVGARLRRTLLGLTQDKLGDAVGLTFQQVQKYERGANRISASRLYQLAEVLNIPASFFFDGMPDPEGQPVSPSAPLAGPEDVDPLARRETLELVRAYYRIQDPVVRRRAFDLVKAISGTAGRALSRSTDGA